MNSFENHGREWSALGDQKKRLQEQKASTLLGKKRGEGDRRTGAKTGKTCDQGGVDKKLLINSHPMGWKEKWKARKGEPPGPDEAP